MEYTEESLKKQEYDNFFFVKPKNLRTREETKKEPASPKKSPLKVKMQPAPKSILKKPTLVSSETTMTSAITSKDTRSETNASQSQGYHEEQPIEHKALAFTSKPAQANAKLMEFE